MSEDTLQAQLDEMKARLIDAQHDEALAIVTLTSTVGERADLRAKLNAAERALEASRAEVDRREGFWGEGWKAGWKAGAEHARREMEILRAQLGTPRYTAGQSRGIKGVDHAILPKEARRDRGAQVRP